MTVLIKSYLSEQDPGKYENQSFEYTLTHSSGASFSVINFGAVITKIMVPDRSGRFDDVELGYKGLDGYLDNRSWHGATVGRSANRVKGAEYEIEGKKYYLPRNDGDNNLHGGDSCFQNVFWNARVLSEDDAYIYLRKTGIRTAFSIEGEAVLMEHLSPDGACGFPGNLEAEVFYAWTRDMTLLIIYSGISDAPTVFSPTNHSYFNLAGEAAGSVAGHILFIDADQVTEKASDNVPNGKLIDVEGTALDFRIPAPIAQTIGSDHPQLHFSTGLDQNYCLNTRGDATIPAAGLTEPVSGRRMEVFTNFPGLQAYSGNFLTGDSKGDKPYERHGAVCLEAQLYPDAVHHSEFPSAVIPANAKTFYITGYRFSVIK